MNSTKEIAVIGLGYVGLPLAVEFGKKYKTIGFDIDRARVVELKKGQDKTLEVSTEVLKAVVLQDYESLLSSKTGFLPTTDLMDIQEANVYIITVPTPTDKNNRPVLTPLIKASETVGKFLKKEDIVIYESTV
ncbi:MAG: nucleotide sugar dehydrogenase, partial [Bacteroidia bacterium]|nr:nucleotide sugar dehydrogenase [Bacteroidia bacterium]